jgi:hypothetical protein
VPSIPKRRSIAQTREKARIAFMHPVIPDQVRMTR